MSRPTAAQLIQPPPQTGKGSLEAGQVRVRQHLNPLARRWRQPIQLPQDWYSTAFEKPALPLVVDVGVAKGRFLLKLAKQDKTRNFLGIEIREPLVHQANRTAADAGLTNLIYLAGNANVSLLRILNDAPLGVLRDVYIQFCDPWFKKRHAKRRMVNNQLVRDVHNVLAKSRQQMVQRNGSVPVEPRLFVQSDVFEVAVEMTQLFDHHGGFSRVRSEGNLAIDENGWLLGNPIGIPTERETAVLSKGGAIYRALYHIKDSEYG
ncbi:tRNA (guanine-N(7)-)-methyltransferase [Gracilariopsis chorda]|uniref:tRNA (guanine(46)-N(7))-methyltransferase n=1 Tax=Gracilariopsis chorda TaxID=448386 RepID=A0A2V3IES2_9FLOR|nr:tRNA (guanine-N(7)-)-methyltransferase [Gracilariopsis chorda]|eukprot:PXF40585.1 tRNA (guanine-N(7)-)-methyltransferase [Gracilariopsis chorda]